MESRPPIPTELRRSVLVESGHRCAIPTCKNPDIDIHHIVPWEKCQKHEFTNLIALCPNCHRRAHNGEIDRKSLIAYKSRLAQILRTGIEDYQADESSETTASAHPEAIKSKAEFAANWGFKNEDDFAFNEPIGSSVDFFYSNRFVAAFPGVRGIKIFEDPKTILDRLSSLLKSPLEFGFWKSGDSFSGYLTTPIWWWGRGNNQIKNFRRISDTTAILDSFEITPRKLAAVNLGSHRHVFVYLETAPMEPTGLYSFDDDQRRIKDEEYGFFKGKAISRAEYDDGYAEINGEIVKLDDTCELRIRHVSPFNLIIAAHGSPINNGEFDSELQNELDSILSGSSDLRSLTDKIRRLPRLNPEL